MITVALAVKVGLIGIPVAVGALSYVPPETPNPPPPPSLCLYSATRALRWDMYKVQYQIQQYHVGGQFLFHFFSALCDVCDPMKALLPEKMNWLWSFSPLLALL